MVDTRKEAVPSSESAPVSISAGLLLETGIESSSPHRRRLVMVRQARGGQWGIVAGKFIFQPQENIMETVLQIAFREMEEETGLTSGELTHWHFLGHIYIPRKSKLSLGFVFEAMLSGEPDRLTQGYTPPNSTEISQVRSFSIDGVLELLKKTSLIYRPEFNVQLLKFWAFDRICDKYDPWEGESFAQEVAEARTGFPPNVRNIFHNQLWSAR